MYLYLCVRMRKTECVFCVCEYKKEGVCVSPVLVCSSISYIFLFYLFVVCARFKKSVSACAVLIYMRIISPVFNLQDCYKAPFNV